MQERRQKRERSCRSVSSWIKPNARNLQPNSPCRNYIRQTQKSTPTNDPSFTRRLNGIRRNRTLWHVMRLLGTSQAHLHIALSKNKVLGRTGNWYNQYLISNGVDTSGNALKLREMAVMRQNQLVCCILSSSRN